MITIFENKIGTTTGLIYQLIDKKGWTLTKLCEEMVNCGLLECKNPVVGQKSLSRALHKTTMPPTLARKFEVIFGLERGILMSEFPRGKGDLAEIERIDRIEEEMFKGKNTSN